MRLVALVVSMSAAFIACGGSTPFAKGEDCLRTFSGHSDQVCAVALGPSGKQMVSGGADGKIKFWDVESGQCRRTLDGHSEWVQSVALSSDGQSLASGGRDDLVKLWEVESGELRKTFVGHSGIVTSVTYSRDGRLLASCGRDKSIKIWDVASAKCSKTLGSGDFFTSSAVLFTPDSRQLLFGGDSLQLWDVDSGTRLRDFKGHTDSVGAIAISGNGKCIVSAGSYEDKTIRLWEAESGNCLWKKDCAKQGGGAWSLIFVSEDGVLVSGHYDGSIRFWDVRSGAPLRTIKAHEMVVSSLSTDAKGRYFVSGSWDATIKLWKVPSR